MLPVRPLSIRSANSNPTSVNSQSARSRVTRRLARSLAAACMIAGLPLLATVLDENSALAQKYPRRRASRRHGYAFVSAGGRFQGLRNGKRYRHPRRQQPEFRLGFGLRAAPVAHEQSPPKPSVMMASPAFAEPAMDRAASSRPRVGTEFQRSSMTPFRERSRSTTAWARTLCSASRCRSC